MNYIIYARKSTEDREDRQVLSIDSQIEEIQRKFPDLNVIEIIRESKSAYKPYNRPEFQRMLELFESGKADGCLAWHPDRLSREPISAGMIMHLLDRGLIKDLKFASYGFNNSPEGKMMLSISLSQSKYFSEKLSIDVKRGMIKKCKNGHMPTRPPVGYMSDRLAEKGEKKVILDPERFDLVRKIFDLFLTGQYSIPKIQEAAESIGLNHRATKRSPAKPISKNGFHKMFSNIFYTGQFIWDGETYKGNHPAMITMEEFEKIQSITGKRHVPRPQKYESLTSGLVRCSCGAAIVVDQRKKTIKKTGLSKLYKYVRCTQQKKKGECQESILRLEALESQIIDYLAQIKISPALHQWAIKNINKENEKTLIDQKRERRRLKDRHENCQKQLDNLLKLKISPENTDGSLLSDAEFKTQKQLITKEREQYLEMIQRFDDQADKWMNITVEAFDIAANAIQTFSGSTVQEKKVLLSKIGANFILKDKKLAIEAKYPYFIFEKYVPLSHQLERKLGGLKKAQEEAKKSVSTEINKLWSG